MKILLIEGEKITIEEFIAVNSAEDVEPIDPEQLELLNQLPINESMYVGMLEVLRLS